MSARILSGIYRIRNTVNGCVYVGSAVNFTDRWRRHTLDLSRGSHHCPPLQDAWVEDGETAFVFEIIEAVECNKKALDLREQAHLDEALATGLAYNIARKAYSCLGVKRPMISITMRIPEDVLEDLKRLAPFKGLAGYQGLIRAYIGQGLRVDLERYGSPSPQFIERLKNQGVSATVIAQALADLL
jgi:hypothetical protein